MVEPRRGSPMDVEGDTSERFERVRELGAGASGVVWLARDRQYGHDVALKEVRAPTDEHRWLLRREFRAVATVLHPNLVQHYELWESGGATFLTMAHVDGQDLPAFVQRTLHEADPATRWLDTTLRRVFVGVLRGLEALHSRGIVHRDVKPRNIRVTHDGHGVLVDFGFTSTTGAEGVLGRAGSPRYLAPEQLTTVSGLPASDVYALALCWWEALTDTPPWAPDDLLSRVDGRAPSGTERLPDAARDILLPMLSVAPEARPPVGRVLEALEGPSPPPRVTEPSVFVGRATEVAAIAGVLAPDAGTTLGVAVVSGPGGIGKTRLVHEAIASHGTALQLIHARVHPRESVPFRALDALGEELASRLVDQHERIRAPEEALRRAAALLPVFGVLSTTEDDAAPRSPREVRARAADALVDLFRLLASVGPVVVWIDDAQWADPDSVTLLGAVLGALAEQPIRLVLTTRETVSSVRDRWGDVLDRSRARVELSLAPLTMPDALALVSARAPGLPGATAEAIAHTAQGNPFVLGALAADGRAPAPDQPWSERILAGTHAVAPDARRWLELLSVVEGPVDERVAVRAAVAFDGAVDTLHALLRARMVTLDASLHTQAVRILHDRLRDLVADALDDDVRRRLHEQLAEAHLALGGTDAHATAVHLRGANRGAEAGAWMLRAADEAMDALAFATAAERYQDAASLFDRDEPSVLRAWRGEADALAAAGRTRDAATRYEALAVRSPEDRSSALQRAAELWIGIGRLGQGRALLRELLGTLGLMLPSSLVGRWGAALLWRVVAGRVDVNRAPRRPATPQMLHRIDILDTVAGALAMFDGAMTVAFQARLLVAAVDAGEPTRLARALVMELNYAELSDGTSPAVERLRRRLDELAPEMSPAARAFARLGDGFRAFHLGRFPEADVALTDAIAQYERTAAHSWERHQALATHLFVLLQLGDLVRLREASGRAHAVFSLSDDVATQATVRLVVDAALALGDDAPDRSATIVREAGETWIDTQPVAYAYLEAVSVVQRALYEGRMSDACAELEARWPTVRKLFIFHQPRIFLRWQRGVCALANVANDPRGHRRARRMLRQLRRERLPWAQPFVLVLEGLLAAHARAPDAPDRLLRAARAFDALGTRAMASCARAAAAQLTGDPEALTAAHTSLRTLGVVAPHRFQRVYVPLGDALV